MPDFQTLAQNLAAKKDALTVARIEASEAHGLAEERAHALAQADAEYARALAEIESAARVTESVNTAVTAIVEGDAKAEVVVVAPEPGEMIIVTPEPGETVLVVGPEVAPAPHSCSKCGGRKKA
jgi:hypothetical protein